MKKIVTMIVTILLFFTLLKLLKNENLEKRRLLERSEMLNKLVTRMDGKLNNLENGLKMCADEKPIRIQLSRHDFVDVVCKRTQTNVWGFTKKTKSKK